MKTGRDTKNKLIFVEDLGNFVATLQTIQFQKNFELNGPQDSPFGKEHNSSLKITFKFVPQNM